MDIVPEAVQVELKHCNKYYGVYLSPFVCAYYLMFRNYYGLRQYDNMHCALRQLIDAVFDPEQHENLIYHSYNIAGHCLMLIGETVQALDLFKLSYETTLINPAHHPLNSANYYLQFFEQTANYNWQYDC